MVDFLTNPLNKKAQTSLDSIIIQDDGTYPNNKKLPLLVLPQVFSFEQQVNPKDYEAIFKYNGWTNTWRNGLFSFHHYHSTAHEVLGVYQGWVKAQFGGPSGKMLKARAGDVLIIPAGVAHKNLGQSTDFSVVGAYPIGQNPDMNEGKKGERPLTDQQIKKVPFPVSDPVFGKKGPVISIWTRQMA